MTATKPLTPGISSLQTQCPHSVSVCWWVEWGGRFHFACKHSCFLPPPTFSPRSHWLKSACCSPALVGFCHFMANPWTPVAVSNWDLDLAWQQARGSATSCPPAVHGAVGATALPEAGEDADGQEQSSQGGRVAAGIKHLHSSKVGPLEEKGTAELAGQRGSAGQLCGH